MTTTRDHHLRELAAAGAAFARVDAARQEARDAYVAAGKALDAAARAATAAGFTRREINNAIRVGTGS